MTGGKRTEQNGKKTRSGPGKRRRTLLAAAIAAALVLVLALLLGSGESRRYERYRSQAAASYQKGDYDQALSSLRKAEAIQSSRELRMLMADCYEAQGNWDLALEVLRQMDRDDEAVTERIAALEQRRQQLQQDEDQRIIAGRSFAASATELDLSGQGLGNGVLQEITQLHALTRLSLADNALSDLGALSSLGGLRSLNLAGNQIKNLRPLSQLRDLRSLNLDRNPVTDLTPLYSLEELSSLSLLGAHPKEGQVEALSAALPFCAILTDGEEEGTQCIFLSGVRFDTTVTDLNLSGLQLREVGFLSLCTQLQRLDLSDNALIDLSPLMDLQQLDKLILAGNRLSDLRPLIGLQSLRHLDVSRNLITETSAAGSLTELLSLDLSDNPVQDFSGLKKLVNLERLSLENTGLTDGDLLFFSGMKRLAALSLDRNDGLTAEAVKTLKASIPDCTVSHGTLVLTISLGGEDFRTDVTSLCIEGTELSDLFGLEKFDCLETVRLGRNRIEDLSAFQNTHCREMIRSLDLSFNKIRDLSPLTALKNLEILDLRSNQISSINPLLRMSQLKKLDLSGNPLEQEQIEELRRSLPDCEIIF